jgi:hypothetical protein
LNPSPLPTDEFVTQLDYLIRQTDYPPVKPADFLQHQRLQQLASKASNPRWAPNTQQSADGG